MPTVIINDVALEARVGERLLSVARRNAAHIGFVCDGNGICQTCQCRVLAGAEQLSPPNEAERIWMPENRLAAGYRLACQTALRGAGTVEVRTSVEELRRQTLNLVAPGRSPYRRDRLEPLLDNVVRRNVDQLIRFPFNVVGTLLRVGPWRLILPWQDPARLIDDGLRISRKMISGVDRIERPLTAGEPAARSISVGEVVAPPALPPSHEEQILTAVRNLRQARAEVRRYV